MKHFFLALLALPSIAAAAPEQILPLSCETNTGFTVNSSLTAGTISITGSKDLSTIGVFPMKFVKKENGKTYFQAAIPMISAEVTFDEPQVQEGIYVFRVELKTQLDRDVNTEELFCVSTDTLLQK